MKIPSFIEIKAAYSLFLVEYEPMSMPTARANDDKVKVSW
jgi:hypothetical protein